MAYLIILAGGKGSRFYPVTKYYPKEMLPIGNLPALHYVINEANNNVIDEIIVVHRYHKDILKSYIENEFKNLGKKITYVHQSDDDTYGTGASIMKLKHIIGKENMFAVSFSDDVVFDNKMFEDMFDLMRKDSLSACIASSEIEQKDISQFGNLRLETDGTITQILQKPKIEETLSKTALVSKLVLSNEIFDYLEEAHYKNELDLGIALANMCKDKKKIKAYDVTGKWITTGDPYNYVKGLNLWCKKFMKKC